MTTEPSSSLYNLRDTVARILRRFRLPREDHKPLFRYVSFDVFRLMAGLEGRATRWGLDSRVYDAQAMNDPLEGRYLPTRSKDAEDTDKGSDKGVLHELALLARQHKTVLRSKLTFILSFTQEKDDLDLWRVYCGGHGACIGFLPSPHLPLYKMAYGEKAADSVLSELAWVVRPILETHDPALCARALAELIPVLYLVKAEGHRAENEVRLIDTRDVPVTVGATAEATTGAPGPAAQDSWSGVSIDDIKSDPKTAARMYIVKERLFFPEPAEYGEVMLGPLAEKYHTLQGADLFLKEVLIRLHRNRLNDVAVTYSRHDLRY